MSCSMKMHTSSHYYTEEIISEDFRLLKPVFFQTTYAQFFYSFYFMCLSANHSEYNNKQQLTAEG